MSAIQSQNIETKPQSTFNSPDKSTKYHPQSTNAYTKYNQITNGKQNKQLCTTNSLFNSMLSMSVTEKQILAHPLIRQIIQKSTKKTIEHNINRIPPGTQLYRIPREEVPKEYQFDCIPPTDAKYCSTGSRKVREINGRLSMDQSLADRTREKGQKNLTVGKKRYQERIYSASDKRVSVSGLVSYSFNSVNARRSLGKIPSDPEQVTLAKKVMEIRKKNSCSAQRQQRIIERKSNRASIQRSEVSKAGVCDFHTPTDKFLKILTTEKEKDDFIYGHKMEKLNCIRQYMEKEKVEYEQASFIVDTIVATQIKPKKQILKKQPINLDDDVELAKRKTILKKKRVIAKHFYFTE